MGGEISDCFILVHKGILYQIAVSHSYLKRKSFLESGKQKIKEPAMFRTKLVKNYNHSHQFIQS